MLCVRIELLRLYEYRVGAVISFPTSILGIRLATGDLELLNIPSCVQLSFDSSVGRAVDCSGNVIHRSLVQIRLEGCDIFIFDRRL